MTTVLVTDGLQRKTLAAVRALGSAGSRVWVADTTRFSLSRFSRWCDRGWVCPPPEDGDRFVAWLDRVGRRYPGMVLMPMDDFSMAAAVAHQAELPFQMLLPSPAQFAIARDKWETVRLARAAGVLHPATVLADSTDAVLAEVSRLGGRALLKPRSASGGRGVLEVADAGATGILARHLRRFGPMLVQERLPAGRKFDVCLFYDAGGRALGGFVQEELRWFPLEFGASTLQESVHRPDLIERAMRLLQPMGWRGPVEVEFLQPAGQEPVLMEINPRIWASVALLGFCGINVFADWLKAALGEPLDPWPQYPAGKRCRWLLPGDLLHFLANPRRFQMQPGFFATYDRRTRDDIICRRDVGPLLGWTLSALRYALSPAMWKMVMRWN